MKIVLIILWFIFGGTTVSSLLNLWNAKEQNDLGRIMYFGFKAVIFLLIAFGIAYLI